MIQQPNWPDACLLACALALCGACSPPSAPVAVTKTPAYRTGEWPLSGVNTMPAKIEIDSATTFRCDGIRCRLLGVREPTDPEQQKLALKFTKRWFEYIGNYIGIYNESNPIVTEDGVCLVWIRGYDFHLACLSEELVRAGLVEIETTPWQQYTFTEPGKARDYDSKWIQGLTDAQAGHARGEQPLVLFDWP